MTTNKTPKKGDIIFICGDYNGTAGMEHATEAGTLNAEIYIRKMRVESWGKKQAHFTDVATGEKVGYRGYTESFRFAWTEEGLNSQIQEIVTSKLHRMQRSLQLDIDWLRDYENVEVSIRCGAVAKAIKRIAALKASSVRFSLIQYGTRDEIREICSVPSIEKRD